MVLGGVELLPADGAEGAEEDDDGVTVKEGAARVYLQGGVGDGGMRTWMGRRICGGRRPQSSGRMLLAQTFSYFPFQ